MKKNIALILTVILLLSVVPQALCEGKEHAEITQRLMTLLDADPALKSMMETSLAMAAGINPDPDTNPAQDLDSFFRFLDQAVTCMPWNVLKGAEYPTLYDHIDQCVDYIWFLLDQPLPELAGEGCYYPSLQYYEPIASWCREYACSWGDYLNTPDSWNDEYYRMFVESDAFHMNDGWYDDANVWTCFNDFFARKLVSAQARPLADADLVAPADSKPQGVWRIDDDSRLISDKGVAIKSGTFSSVRDLIGEDSAYADAFAGGVLTHTFLDVNDYHRYHFPIGGTVLEVRKIRGTNAAGGVTVWDAENRRYCLWDSKPGWQMIETRDCVILDTEFGLVAILPIGMSQICSCNWEDSVQPGAVVRQGDPMGYFLFGGSDIVMVFQNGVDFRFIGETDADGKPVHLLMGESYAELELIDEAVLPAA